MKLVRSLPFQISAVLLLAAAWRIVFFFWDVIPFNSDEAVVALMARHILMGERPIFFYGQAYMGSLDAFLVALGFLLFGQQVWVIRLVQMVLYLAILLLTILIGKEAFGSYSSGILAAVLLAIPTVNVTLYTTATLGGYGEALLIGCLAILVALRVVRRRMQGGPGVLPGGLFVLFGALAGFGLWANALSLVLSAPAALYLLWAMWKFRRGWLAGFFLTAGGGFLLGSLPWWVFAAINGPTHLIQELLGSAVSVEGGPWLARVGQHVINFLLLGLPVTFGFRPPWNVDWLAAPLLPLVLIFWLAVLGFFARQLRKDNPRRAEYGLLAGIFGVLLAGFLFTSFGVDPSGRYFLPLAIPLALVSAQMLRQIATQQLARQPRAGALAAGTLVLLVVSYQLWGNIQCARRFPPGLTTQFYAPTIIDHRADQALIDFLRQEGETRGYSNYWVAYPLAFHSEEEIIFVPRLPYHLDLRYTPRDDRYAPYAAMVDQSQRVAYITTRNPALDDYLRTHFAGLGVQWQEKQIGDYQIYYQLSRSVRPQEIGLGDLRQ